MPQQRKIPAFAPENFRRWFERRGTRAAGKRVLLWPDTFNNYFRPHTAQAAVRVLEAAGFDVALPQRVLCCGRPLYDWGLLDRAKRLLLRTFDTLSDELDAGTPIVVLEPSCASVFRDEAPNLFPLDKRAHRLAEQTFLLSEFIEKYAADFVLPQIARDALVHGHCHHKSIMRMTDEEAVLRRMGVRYSMPAPGCCGMAGAFGFEEGKYEVSCAIGEMDLLPAVRAASAETLMIADGFSCREQMEQCAGRHALHLAEVIDLGLSGEARDAGAEPKRVAARQGEIRRSMWRAGAAVGAMMVLGWAVKRRLWD
jgi:Fe-S oxidoreductase